MYKDKNKVVAYTLNLIANSPNYMIIILTIEASLNIIKKTTYLELNQLHQHLGSFKGSFLVFHPFNHST